LVSSGDDGLALPLWAVGGGGVISVAANIIPKPLVEMWKAWDGGNLSEAKRLFFKLLPFFKALFLETNPVPLKFLMGLTGRMSGEMRPPMGPPTLPVQEKLKALAAEWAAELPPRL
jgi:4-hydroxy-tetrahydrodipicolinate synthase